MLLFPCEIFTYIIFFYLKHLLFLRVKFITILIGYISPSKISTCGYASLASNKNVVTVYNYWMQESASIYRSLEALVV